MTASTSADRTEKSTFLKALFSLFAAVGAVTTLCFGMLLFVTTCGVLAVVKSGSDTGVLKSHSPFIAGIRLEGTITAKSMDKVLDKLEESELDPKAVAVLLEINSPGGAVVPSQEVFAAVGRIKTKKPVFAYVRDMAASGGYYSIANCSQIIANKGSIVGSIGVIFQSVEVTDLLQYLKVKPLTLKTGDLKDAGSPLRPLTSLDRQYLQKLIEDMRVQFQTDVATSRRLDQKTTSYMSNGRVVLASEGLGLKLVDSLGDKTFAVKEILKALNIQENAKNKPELLYLEDKKDLQKSIQDFFMNSGDSKSILGDLFAMRIH